MGTVQEEQGQIKKTATRTRGVLMGLFLLLLVVCAAAVAAWASGSPIALQIWDMCADVLKSLHPDAFHGLESDLAEDDRGTSSSSGWHMRRVREALVCPDTRANVLDVLAGTPYEFGQGAVKGESFLRLPLVARRAIAASEALAAEGEDGVELEAEDELRQVALFLSTTGGGWPMTLKNRLQHILGATCHGSKAFCSQGAVPFAVDSAFTSPGATSMGSSYLHRMLLKAGAATGLPGLSKRAEQYASRPPFVVTSEVETTVGDCLAMRGNSSVALRVRRGEGGADFAFVRRVVIEQAPRWSVHRPHASPRHFSVYGEPVNQAHNDVATPYTEFLGSFEYALAAPAAQTFELAQAMPVRGLRFVFDGPGWGADYICVYRLRAFEGKQACQARRLSSTLQ